MRFLADMGVSITTVEALRAADHNAVHLRDEDLIRLPDREIVAKAVRERRTVLTFDLDFEPISPSATSRSSGSLPPGICLCCVPQPSDKIACKCGSPTFY